MSPLISALQSMLPFGGGMDDDTVAIRSLRLALVIVATLNPVYWAVYTVTTPGAFDPLGVRLVLMAASFGLLALTYAEGPVRRHPRRVLVVVIHALLIWYGVLTAKNHLSPDYSFGYYFTVLAAAMVYSLVWSRPGPMALMLGAAIGIAGGVVVLADPSASAVSPAGFLLVMATGFGVVYAAFIGRLQAVQDLKRSESRLAVAEDLAKTGSWALDLSRGHRTWSDGAYRVLGVDPAQPPVSLAYLIHPDDLERMQADKERLYQGDDEGDHRYRIVRPDGEVRVIRSIVRVARDRAGRPVQVNGAFLDITEQTQYEAELKEARDRAEAAAEAKAAFLNNMSHEIRTPLTAIIGFAQFLSEEVGEEYADLVGPIESGGRRLLGTLNSVLDLARMEVGETDLTLVPTDLAREAREVVQLLRAQASDKGLPLVLDGPAAGLNVLADPDALARVLTNLVSNAIKFTDRGGITVTLRHAVDRVEAVVDDTGRGMDEAFLTELFEPFRQASTGWARSHEGTGLGLTITHKLVEAMNGTIAVESQVGIGTRFVVSLPAALASPRQAVEVSALEPAAW